MLLSSPRSCLAVSLEARSDRKSTRLNSSHQIISYAVFCLKKKKILLVGGVELGGNFWLIGVVRRDVGVEEVEWAPRERDGTPILVRLAAGYGERWQQRPTW